MSEKPKQVKKLLPAIPAGVEPVSPLTVRAYHSLGVSPLLPRPSAKSKLAVKPQETNPTCKASREGEDSAVQVAVRVRPFSKRDLMMGATQVVSMAGNKTSITSSKGKVNMFSYDHCFWSVGAEDTEDYCGQEQVYRELAQPLLDNSFKGYNTCLFAYGQTGSGKSYCIMGEGEEVGIVPRFMKELFNRIEGTSDSKNTFKVQVSYFEIYNEKVYDLLKSTELTSGRKKPKLRVREHQVFGPYVEDLSLYVATSYNDIEHWLKIGSRCRATNATSMNDKSSRSHAVFSITLTHTTVEEEEEHSIVSRINIIDLAGSERSKVSETSGERLKEGASINRSLHTLGKVISLLSDHATGRREKVYIPYRDSTLTWLLKDSLGGNSKTAMIATISPANLHYAESLSTLRYAQQARNIVNVARVNEDPNVKMIRELTSEIHHLRELLALQGGEEAGIEIKKLREQLSESEKLMSAATRSWQEKLRETEERKKQELEQLKASGVLTINNRLPNLVNLTEDPQLSETLLYVLKPGATTVGNNGSCDVSLAHDIELTGALVVQNHCVFVHEGDSVSLQPSSNPDAQTFVNGQLLSSPKILHHGDRVVLGGDYFFRFNYPLEADATLKKGHRDFEYARNEWVKAQTARLEREWEEKILKEREQLLSELEDVRHSAQVEMDKQQVEYQQKLQELNKEMESKALHLTEEQKTKLAAELRVKELLEEKQALEEETMTQRHIIHLEQIKTEREARELEEQRDQLMMDLEQEKQRLEEDIRKLHQNKSFRQTQISSLSSGDSTSLLSNGHSLSSNSSLSSLVQPAGSELVRVSMLLQEATAICKALNKPLSFTRDEDANGVCVHVRNTQLNLVTHWDMDKFEARLEQMRELYHTRRDSLSSIDSEASSPNLNEDPFNNPSDGWVSSPLRSLQRSHSLISTPLATPTTTGTPLHHNTKLQSRYSSPYIDATSPLYKPHLSPPNDFLVSAVIKRISRILDFREASREGGKMLLKLVEHVCRMKEASEDLTNRQSATTRTSEETILTLYTSLEGLTETSRALHESSLQWAWLMGSSSPFQKHFSALETTSELLETIHHQTALYASKLLKGGDTVRESGAELCASLDTVLTYVGGLTLARELQMKILLAESRNRQGLKHQQENIECFLKWPTTEDGKVKVCLTEGACSRCIDSINLASKMIEDLFQETTPTTPQAAHYEALSKLVNSLLAFLHQLMVMQDTIWCVDFDPIALPPVVNMLHTLYQLTQAINSLIPAVLQDKLPPAGEDGVLQQCTGRTATLCNEFAVCVLAMIKASQAEDAKPFSTEVQTLSHQITLAARNLSQLLKQQQMTNS